MNFFVDVVPLRSLSREAPQAYTYSTNKKILSGTIVTIPFRGRDEVGVVIRQAASSEVDIKKIKPVSPIHAGASLTPTQTQLAELLLSQCGATLTQAYRTVMSEPLLVIPVLQARKLINKIKKRTDHSVQTATQIVDAPYSPLHPVFWQRIIQPELKRGQVLCLFPDVQSAEQFEKNVRSKSRSSLYHSQQSRLQKKSSLEKLASGQARLVVGTRSALFLPFRELAAIVLFQSDSEQYQSWDMEPRYDPRELAIALATRDRHVYLLSVSAYLGAGVPKKIVSYGFQPQTPMVVESLREPSSGSAQAPVSKETIAEITSLKFGHHLIYLNHLGDGALICQDCGLLARCQTCSRVLEPNADHCQYCQTLAKETCLACNSSRLKAIGLGVNKVVTYLQKKIPAATVLVWVGQRGKKNKVTSDILSALQAASDKLTIVVATSAILPRLSLFPPFETTTILRPELWFSPKRWKAREELFTSLRLLRAATKKTFRIESYQLDDGLFKQVAGNDVRGFLKQELTSRQRFQYPPYARLVLIRAKHTSQSDAIPTLLPTGTNVRALDGQNYLLTLPPEQSVADVLSPLTLNLRVDINPPSLP